MTLQPHPLSALVPEFKSLFRLLGRTVALAVQQNLSVDINFTRSFLKHILKKDLYISDLDDFVRWLEI